ncbi:MAG: YraN family protein, partial [Gammaproteobacteria bacterium]|nr:YraN family protein [Gammaproteobacteria bacterium]
MVPLDISTPLLLLKVVYPLSPTSYSRGQDAEKACCEFIRQHGLKLVTRNYHGYRGEIDLIMQEGQTLIFIEVR